MPNPSIARAAGAAALALGIALAPAAFAQDFDNQILARKGLMRIQALNLGVLGGMARGQVPYDAEAAQAAADNLVAVGQIDHRFFWPEGSDNFSVETTRALPTIWDNYDAFLAIFDDYTEAAVALQAAAGSGLEALGPAIGGIGRTCGTCHENYQQSE